MVDFEILDVVFMICLFVLSLFGVGVDGGSDGNTVFVDNVSKSVELGVVEILDNPVEIVFCPSVECYNLFEESFLEAKFEIKCAFYEFDVVNLSKILVGRSIDGVSVELIVDDKYLDEEGMGVLDGSDVRVFSDKNRGTRYNNYMHDKFCVIDDEVLIVGSANPTTNGLFLNNNNIFRFESSYLIKNYENEFDEMLGSKFGTNKESGLEFNDIELVYGNDSFRVSSYMCPADSCEDVIVGLLDGATNEILFASFVLTLDSIEDKLVEKSENGVVVNGLIENRMKNSKGSRIAELNESFDIVFDKNKNTMHHKFFVIDERIVITGSMNPSSSGANYNDENILVIEDEDIALMFRDEFFRLSR